MSVQELTYKNITIQEGTKLFETKVLLIKSSLNYSCTTFCSGHQSQNAGTTLEGVLRGLLVPPGIWGFKKENRKRNRQSITKGNLISESPLPIFL